MRPTRTAPRRPVVQERAINAGIVEVDNQLAVADREIQAVHDVADDFAERQRDDGKVVAAQTQHWDADQHTRNRRAYAARQHGQHKAHRLIFHLEGVQQPAGHDDAGERADAHEARVTQRQFAGNADGQIQGNRHDDVNADRDELPLQGAADGDARNHLAQRHLRKDERDDDDGVGDQVVQKAFC